MDRRQKVAENLKKARGSRTRAEIAKEAKVSVSTIQMYEDGKRIPRDAVKIRLARVLGVSITELFFPELS